MRRLLALVIASTLGCGGSENCSPSTCGASCCLVVQTALNSPSDNSTSATYRSPATTLCLGICNKAGTCVLPWDGDGRRLEINCAP